LLFGAPVDEVAGIEGNAEEVGGDKTELGGAHADDADDGAIEGSNDPALPEFFANEHGGENRQHAGQIIEPYDVEQVQHVVMTREQPVPSGMRMCNREATRGGTSAQVQFSWRAASPCNGAI
jgi:hypothetical protein